MVGIMTEWVKGWISHVPSFNDFTTHSAEDVLDTTQRDKADRVTDKSSSKLEASLKVASRNFGFRDGPTRARKA